jgi:hypothetical protein
MWFCLNVGRLSGPADKKMREIRFELVYINYTRIKYVRSVPVLSKELENVGIGWQQLAQLINPGQRSVGQSPKIYERISCALII